MKSQLVQKKAEELRARLDKASPQQRDTWLALQRTNMKRLHCAFTNEVNLVKIQAYPSANNTMYCPNGLLCRVTNDYSFIGTACNSALLLTKSSGRELDYIPARRNRIRMMANTQSPIELWDILFRRFPDSPMPLYSLPLIYQERESANRAEMTDPKYVGQFSAIFSYQENDHYYLPYMHAGWTFYNVIEKNLNYTLGVEEALRAPQAVVTKLENAILNIHPNGTQILADISQMPRAPICWITSSGNGQSQRHTYVRELLKHIDIDSWGKAVKTRNDPPEWWNYGNAQKFGAIQYDIKRLLMSHYPFYLVFENAICPGYVTEKIWQSLQVGTIPIYLGTRDIIKFVPHPDAVIQTRDYESPAKLARYLRYLTNTPEALDKHRSAW
eukprot:CAMPEP_0197307068 /NCGR_PEP_ID=MMETSP0891-20130614/4492_1 /TAXON_ID=44058 ORGANISM="Aureoumbra lagunensis, Strain CCMP1510" /NCGR_SAMPLE_ID=MMETSP0891 /ASSEMBLY_ACC=CAM_ASM_000534 /LENGTH=384 /DNA_ID=CAMNT_0042790047 /DNA_START=313 /DNA_END=1464 /DNA_ORIENTATION=-